MCIERRPIWRFNRCFNRCDPFEADPDEVFMSENSYRILYLYKRFSRSSLGLKRILKMPGLEPGTSRKSMLSECAYPLRYMPVDPSAHMHCI